VKQFDPLEGERREQYLASGVARMVELDRLCRQAPARSEPHPPKPAASPREHFERAPMPQAVRAALAQAATRQGVPVTAILGRGRQPQVVAARREVCHLLRARGWSQTRIGRALGRDHTTVLRFLRQPAPNARAPRTGSLPWGEMAAEWGV